MNRIGVCDCIQWTEKAAFSPPKSPCASSRRLSVHVLNQPVPSIGFTFRHQWCKGMSPQIPPVHLRSLTDGRQRSRFRRRRARPARPPCATRRNLVQCTPNPSKGCIPPVRLCRCGAGASAERLKPLAFSDKHEKDTCLHRRIQSLLRSAERHSLQMA